MLACAVPVVLSLAVLQIFMVRRLENGMASAGSMSPAVTEEEAVPLHRPEAGKEIVLTVAAIVLFLTPVPAPLTEHGREEAALLGLQVRSLPIDGCLHTRFGRTAETARIAMDGRDVPIVEEALFDDVYVGDLEGKTIDDYRAWKMEHTRADAFPGGESLDDAARRYATAFERLLARGARRILVVCHEIPVRYALNAAAGSETLDGPAHEIGNCIPHLFDEDGLHRAVDGIRRLVGR